jgi:hypothetical protein
MDSWRRPVLHVNLQLITSQIEVCRKLQIKRKSRPARILLSDRNRADLDWCNREFKWQYRNRPKFQRTISFGSYKPAPYVSAEFFCLSQYLKWSTTALYAGVLFPVGKRFSLDAYYEHQNLTGKRPNQQLNQLGVMLNMYLGLEKER